VAEIVGEKNNTVEYNRYGGVAAILPFDNNTNAAVASIPLF